MSFASIGSFNTWGFSSSFDCLDLVSSSDQENESNKNETISILLINPGDYRHVLETISTRFSNEKNNQYKFIEFYIIEYSIDSICRNILLLDTFLNTDLPFRIRANTFLEMFGNSKIQMRTKEYMNERSRIITNQLIKNKSSEPSFLLSSIVDLSSLKYRDRDSMEKTFNRYKEETSPRTMTTLLEHRHRGYYTDRYDSRQSLAEYDYYNSIKGTSADIIHLKQFRGWRSSGIAFEMNDQQYTEDNHTLLSYAEGMMKTGPDRGLKKEMLGYWSDVTSSPFYSFGINTSPSISTSTNKNNNSFIEGLFEIVNKDTGTEQRRHHTVEIALLNLLSWMWESEMGSPYTMTRANDIYSGLGTDPHTSTQTDSEEDSDEAKRDQETETISINNSFLHRSWQGAKIIPILAIPSSSTSIIDIAVATELAKSKYQNKFDCMYISSRSVGVMKSISNNGVLGLMKSNSNSIVALETAKYIVNVTKQQKIDFIGSLNILAASHHLEQIPVAPVNRCRRDEKDTMEDVLFYRPMSDHEKQTI